MPELSLILFDDQIARSWEPFALTRPASELLFGALTQRERAEKGFRTRCAAVLAADHLAGFAEEGTPPVRRLADAPRGGDRLFLVSRAIVEAAAAARSRGELRPGPIVSGESYIGWYAPEGHDPPPPEFLLEPGGANTARYGEPSRLPGRTLRNVWDLIAGNADRISEDVRELFPSVRTPELPSGVHRLGSEALVVGDGVEIEPGVVLDTRAGPIWLDDGARIRAFTRLAGPVYVGRRSVVLGGPLEAVSIGPVCKVRGELADSVCLGYSNKQHDGHIGHAYLGRWVNLGAETTNSDLKNNYGTIRIWTPAGEVDSGTIKLGSLIGDHVKTGIGLLLNTGTVVGAGSNLFGAAMPPRYVPPFSWGTGEELTEFRLEKFLEVAARAMSRRDVELDEEMRRVLERAWSRGRREA